MMVAGRSSRVYGVVSVSCRSLFYSSPPNIFFVQRLIKLCVVHPGSRHNK